MTSGEMLVETRKLVGMSGTLPYCVEDSVGFFDNLFGGNRTKSAKVAKERLLTVLVHDRVKLTPEMLEQLKEELSVVINRYIPNVESREIEVTLLHGESSDHLKADIPLRRAK
jgi:cell division topological specificity factor